jgi:hypothetical protein
MVVWVVWVCCYIRNSSAKNEAGGCAASFCVQLVNFNNRKFDRFEERPYPIRATSAQLGFVRREYSPKFHNAFRKCHFLTGQPASLLSELSI